MSLNINIKLLDGESFTNGSTCRFELDFYNKYGRDILIDEIVTHFESHCLINLLNLKRFNKQNDVDLFLQKLFTKYKIYEDNIKDDRTLAPNHIIIWKSCSRLIQNGILNPEDNYKVIIKMKIPDEVVCTYRSKCIQFWSVIKFSVRSANCQINMNDYVVPINIINPYLYATISTGDNDDTLDDNPFEIKETLTEISPTSEFPLDMLLDRHSNAKYRITYQESPMCFLTLLKSQICIGDDINIILNFVPNSDIRCMKFSVSLKFKENLLIPSELPQGVNKICLSTKEFGPFDHNSLFIEIFPVTLKVPNDQYPSIESDIFQLLWFLEFKFMITNSKDIALNANKAVTKEVVSWELKHSNKEELLQWHLPLTIYPLIKSEIY